MTKPVAVFRSEVIEDSRHTVRLDKNSQMGSRGRPPTAIYRLYLEVGGPFHVQLREWVFVRWTGPLE
jgi:hypothetical protein